MQLGPWAKTDSVEKTRGCWARGRGVPTYGDALQADADPKLVAEGRATRWNPPPSTYCVSGTGQPSLPPGKNVRSTFSQGGISNDAPFPKAASHAMLPFLSKRHRTMRCLDSAEGAVMKQARMWLLIAAALLVLPQAALGAKPPATPAPAATGSGEIELDAPASATAPGAAAPAAPGADTGVEAAPGATGGGICEI